MSKSARRLLQWFAAAVICGAAVASIYQIRARSIACNDLLCQLRYAAAYTSVAGLPLAMLALIGAAVLVLVFILFQLSPGRLRTVTRTCTMVVCVGGLLLTLRMAAIETILLHGWSWSCAAASWLSSLLFCAGMLLAVKGYPGTRSQGAGLAVGAILAAGLSWHLAQAGGIARVQKQQENWSLLSSQRSHSLGPASAPVQIVEFADFQCPPCRRVAPALRKLAARYSGSVRLVQRELPNVQIHPQAERAAEIAECFGEQGKFWEAAAELYQFPVPDDTQLFTWAARFGASGPQFMECMAQHRGLAAIIRDREDAHALGISHTPTLFIGTTMVEGAVSFEKLEGLLLAEVQGHPQPAESASVPLAPAGNGCVVQSAADITTQKKDAGCR